MVVRGKQQPEEPQPTEENEVTTPASLGFTREIEVEPVREAPIAPDQQGFAVIRMAKTIEEFTYGNPHIFYNLKEGHRYRVPINIAAYLDSLGYVYH